MIGNEVALRKRCGSLQSLVPILSRKMGPSASSSSKNYGAREGHAPARALLLSSSSARTATEQAELMTDPGGYWSVTPSIRHT